MEAEQAAEELKLRLSAKYPSVGVQVAALSSADNETFVELIAAQSIHARLKGTLLARRLEMDLLLRLSGDNQIAAAIAAAGAKKGERNILILLGRAGDLRKIEIENSLAGKRLPRKALSTEELGRVERAALLDSNRA